MIEATEIVVIGAGASGIAAAWAAASSGSRVVLLDEQDAPGGWLRTSLERLNGPPDFIDGKYGFEAAHLAPDLVAVDGLDYRPKSIVWGLFENRLLGVVSPGHSYQLEAKKIIIASGSTEIVWPFEGWTLPGTMTATAARRFMHLHRVLPGRRVAVVGQGMDADRMADDLDLAGATVVSRAPTPDGLAARGDRQVSRLVVDDQEVEADAVILALGSLPDPELARHVMAELEYSEVNGCHVPTRDRTMRTSVDSVYVVGDAAGLAPANVTIAEGFIAGYAAAGNPKLDDAIRSLAKLGSRREPGPPIADPARIPDEVLVDREEQITARQIRDAIRAGAVSVNDVKRRTRAGMGIAQGRDTEYIVSRMISHETGIPLDQLVPMTARPPARLVSLAELASVAAATD